jgi:hypothetical protein
MMGGGSDSAGFVQVIQGKVTDMAKLKAMVSTDTETLHRERPEILGGSLAIEPDGTFTETIFFTDEAAAREGEKKEMPAEIADTMQTAMQDVRYLDLHHPWFESAR